MTTRDLGTLHGLVAATFTPTLADGTINVPAIRPMVDHLVDRGMAGMYVLGSTGEGVSLRVEERMAVAEAFVDAAAARIPVIVQVGCESLREARALASHAQRCGADAISATSPLYFKPDSAESLAASMAEIASGASELPFYYYHIPAVTGVNVSMVEFLGLGIEKIPTLRGIKFTSTDVFAFQSCVEFAKDRFQIFWGLDEMLLCGLSAGATAAVGSTYNFAAPIYTRLIQAFESGDLNQANRQQSRSQALVRTFLPYGARAAQKAIMSMIDYDCGPPRLPVSPLSRSDSDSLKSDLQSIGFFDWIDDHAI